MICRRGNNRTRDDELRASLTDANGNVTGFAYDRFDRPMTTTYPDGSTEGATWDAAGNLLTRTTRAGATLRYGYDTLNRLVTKTAAASPVACSAATSATPTVTYSYDLASRVTRVCDNGAVIPAVAAPPSAAVYGTAYAYDATNRPTGVTFDPVPTPLVPLTGFAVSLDFGYNAANQRVSLAASDNAWIDYPLDRPMVIPYAANNLNQYTTADTVMPTYDGNGNLTSDGTFTFGYDAENRLTSASKTGLSASYAFDAQGRRKSKSVTTGPVNTTTVFVTDADNREVLEYDGATGMILRWYAYGLGPNEVLAQANLGLATLATPVPDLLGSVVATVDPGTGPIARYGYKPYGESSSAPAQFGFTGQRVDAEIGGYYYYRARHYSPAWGRFLQPDPLGYRVGPNVYAYVGNDPLNLADPTGLAADSPNVDADQSLFNLVAGGPNDRLQIPGGGRLQSNPQATGPHSTFRYNQQGQVQNYETYYERNPVTGLYVPTMRFRGEGKPHGGVEPPFILERAPGKGPGATPSVPRPALPSEIPGGGAPPLLWE